MNHIIRVDGGALSSAPFGTATVSREIIRALRHYAPREHLYIYTLKNTRPSFAWNTLAIPLRELRYIGDKGMYLALNSAVPLWTAGPAISICHGLSFHAYPQLYDSPRGARRLERLTRTMITRSTHILVSSKKVQQELQKWYAVSSKRITVLPFGFPHGFAPSKRFKRKKIILWVGMPHAIKRLDLAIAAFTQLIKKEDFHSYKLVLAGIAPSDITAHPSILALGPVSQEILIKLYSEAQCLLVTSLYESFHFPTLEALASGTPVVSVQEACIPELAPYVRTTKNNPDKIAQTITKIINNPRIISYQKLKQDFSWERYVQTLKTLY